MTSMMRELSSIFLEKTAAFGEIDALESYPGEHSSNDDKIRAAINVAVDDLNNISNMYHMYQSQYREAYNQLSYQKKLFDLTKQVQEIAKNAQDNTTLWLRNNLKNLEIDAANIHRETGIKVRLTELQSYRILKAIIDDEVVASLPKNKTDWVELSKLKREMSGFTGHDDETVTVAPTSIYEEFTGK